MFNLTPHSTMTPHFYGLPKIHTENRPLRATASSIKSLFRALSKGNFTVSEKYIPSPCIYIKNYPCFNIKRISLCSVLMLEIYDNVPHDKTSSIVIIVSIAVFSKSLFKKLYNILLFTGLEIFLMFICKLVGTLAIITSINMIHYEIIYTLSIVTIGLLFMITIFISIVYGYRRIIIEQEAGKLYLPRVHIQNDCYRIDLKKPIHQGRFTIGNRDYYVDPVTGSRFTLHRQYSDIDSKRSFDASYPSTSGTHSRVDCIRCGCQPMLEEEELK